MVHFGWYVVNPHVQAVQNMCGQRWVEGVLGQVIGGQFYHIFNKKSVFAVLKKIFEIELAHLNHLFP